MHTKNTNKTASPDAIIHQAGSVLPISLFILLVLTIIGATSLNDTVMEEKMSSNFQKGNIAFQAAESSVNRTFKNVSNTITLAGRAIIAKEQAMASGDDPVWPEDETATVEGATDAGDPIENTHSSIELNANVRFADANSAPGGCTLNIGSQTKCSTVVLDIVASGTVTGTNVTRTLTQGMEKPLPPGS